MFKTEAKVTIKKGQVANKEDIVQSYQKVVFEGTGKDENGKVISDKDEEALLGEALAFLQEQNPKGNAVIELLKNLTYSYDLGVRASVRQQLVTAAAGPDKAIEKAVKDYMAARAAMGRPVSEEVARRKVMED